MTTLALKRSPAKIKALTALLAVLSAVLLPQVFHAAGVLSGSGPLLGTMFLPMHIPVILAGLLGGPVVGLVAGLVSPAVSFAISGMPTAAMLPLMVLELGAYGLMGGLLQKAKMPVFAKLVITQIVGRAVRAAAVLAAVYLFGSQTVSVASILTMVTTAIPGILLQWALIPLLLYRMNGLNKYFEN